MKYLFVGGIWDGWRVEAEGLPYMRVAVPAKIGAIGDAYDIGLQLNVQTQSYRLERFGGGDPERVIYEVYMCQDEVLPGGGMAALIAGYRLPKSDDPLPEDPAKTRAVMERLVARLEHIKGRRTPEYLRDEPPAP